MQPQQTTDPGFIAKFSNKISTDYADEKGKLNALFYKFKSLYDNRSDTKPIHNEVSHYITNFKLHAFLSKYRDEILWEDETLSRINHVLTHYFDATKQKYLQTMLTYLVKCTPLVRDYSIIPVDELSQITPFSASDDCKWFNPDNARAKSCLQTLLEAEKHDKSQINKEINLYSLQYWGGIEHVEKLQPTAHGKYTGSYEYNELPTSSGIQSQNPAEKVQMVSSTQLYCVCTEQNIKVSQNGLSYLFVQKQDEGKAIVPKTTGGRRRARGQTRRQRSSAPLKRRKSRAAQRAARRRRQ